MRRLYNFIKEWREVALAVIGLGLIAFLVISAINITIEIKGIERETQELKEKIETMEKKRLDKK